MRIQETSSLGRDAQRYYLGGYGSIVGYDWRSLSGLHTVLVQEEVRGPLLRRAACCPFPSPWSLPPVGGAMFVNGAWTWDRILPQQVGSARLAFFIGGGYYPVFRWDYAWLTRDFSTIHPPPGVALLDRLQLLTGTSAALGVPRSRTGAERDAVG